MPASLNFFCPLAVHQATPEHDWNVLCNCKLKKFLQGSFSWQPFAGI
ncbi:hypothetical protein ACADC178_0979 [Lactobacillus delbrueckii subsp. lactis]|nr:hypothetical protein ACADC178_0979 [Lactobacillus delbrueckii subsp. lactis]